MFYQNQILIEGRLCQTPQIKETKSGKSYCQFSICYNKAKKLSEPNDKGYNYDYVPNFFNCTAWNKTAENVAKLSKGDPVTVSGTLSQESWEKDGQKIYKVLILVNSIKKLDLEKKRKEYRETSEIAEYDDSKDSVEDKRQDEFDSQILDDGDIPF